MDFKDREIIDLVQEPGKLSYSEIGDKVDLSITAVKERMRKLISSGTISESLHIPNPEMLGLDICAFVQVLMPVPTEEENFVEKIALVPEVQECHYITGDYSYLLKIRVRNTKDLEKLIGEKIKTIAGVKRTNTLISLTTFKETLRLRI